MKKGKKLVSLLLVLLMVCALPFSVHAADSPTTFDRVVLSKKVVNNNGYVDFYVTMFFSDYVHINNAGKIFFTYYYNPNTGHSHFWQESLVANSVTYQDTQVGDDGLTYGKNVTGKFSVRPAYVTKMDASLLADSANSWGVRITEYGFYANDGLVSPDVIADINGNGIKNHFHVNNNSDIAWQDLQGFTSLEKILLVGEHTASNGYKDFYVKMIFSDYVHINLPGKVFFTYCYAPNTGDSFFWQESLVSNSITYEDTQVGADGLTYGKSVIGKFSVRPNYVSRMEDSLAADASYSYGVRFTEYDYYANDGVVSPSVVQDMYGRGIQSTIHVNNSSDIAWCDTVAMPHVVSAEVQNANAATVDMLVTFSKPVSMPCTNYWDVMMRFTSATNGTNQQRMQKRTYINPQTIDGKTYSDKIMITFNAGSQPLAGNVGIVFAEYNHHDNQHGNDYQISSNVAFDVNGTGLAPTELTVCTNASTGCSNARVALAYVKATLAEQAQAITSVSRVDATHVSVKFPMNVTNIDITKAITLGNCPVTAVEGNADTWTFTLDRALTAADTVLTIPANAVTTGYNGTVVAKEMTATLPFADQVQAGGTVTLTEDLTVEELAVAEGVTLDLNGHVLTAQTIVSHGNVINSQSSGGIKIGKNVADDNKLMLHADNEQLALYDAEFGGYRFFSVTAGHLEKERADSVVFGIQLTASAQAMELLLHEDNADVKLQTVFTLTVDGEEREIPPYFYQAELLAEYLQTVQSGAAGNWAITLQVYGFEATAHNSIVLTAMPTLVSATGVTVTPGAAGVHTYTYTK